MFFHVMFNVVFVVVFRIRNCKRKSATCGITTNSTVDFIIKYSLTCLLQNIIRLFFFILYVGQRGKVLYLLTQSISAVIQHRRYLSEYGATVEWYWHWETEVLGEEAVPVLLLTQQATYELVKGIEYRPPELRGRQVVTWNVSRSFLS